MNLLFIENRHKTFFYEKVALELIKEGHEVSWLIQNKEFLPKKIKTSQYIIQYPKSYFLFKERKDIEEIIKSDRQINHFKKKDKSYFYYYDEEIKKILLKIKPDVVFGESTSFHELLTINNCQKLDILYLNPSTCRYPVGRFSFYINDTLDPYMGSGEDLRDNEAQEIINQIVKRESRPDYMKLKPASRKEKVMDGIKKVYSYYQGEKYNTPHPLIKYKIEKKKYKQIKQWDNIAEREVVGGQIKVLYPLQMQPEANIDVWGKKHREQADLINKISNSLPEDSLLYVKPNPKSKYELSQELIDLIQSKKNIVSLTHDTKMDHVLPHIDLVITVTGTIAIECILSNKPVITLVKTINNSSDSCQYLEEINKANLKPIIDSIRSGKYKLASNEEKIDFINLLNKKSFEGIISDPYTDQNCIEPTNVKNITKAFKACLNSL